MRQIFPPAPGAGAPDLARLYAYPDRPGPGREAGQPWVRANMVASADGAATLGGRSGALSGPADRRVLSLLRALADVILVGAQTARAEGYGPVRPGRGRGWARLREGRPTTPPIAVVTRGLDLDPAGALLSPGPGLARPIVLTTESAPASRRAAAAATADVVVAGADSVEPGAAIDALAERGHHRVLAEGGPRLLGQIADAGLLDELCLTVSPLLAGGTGRVLELPATPPGPPGPAPGPLPLERLNLAHVLEDGGFLLCRYLTVRETPGGA